jgi:ATP synthase protein I
MTRIILMQLLAALVVALIALLLGGEVAGISAVLGGLSCALPNALFAVRLHLATLKPGGASPVTFFVGEFVKILLTLACLAAVALLYRDVNWLAFIASVIIVLKSYIFLLFRNQS